MCGPLWSTTAEAPLPADDQLCRLSLHQDIALWAAFVSPPLALLLVMCPSSPPRLHHDPALQPAPQVADDILDAMHLEREAVLLQLLCMAGICSLAASDLELHQAGAPCSVWARLDGR